MLSASTQQGCLGCQDVLLRTRHSAGAPRLHDCGQLDHVLRWSSLYQRQLRDYLGGRDLHGDRAGLLAQVRFDRGEQLLSIARVMNTDQPNHVRDRPD